MSTEYSCSLYIYTENEEWIEEGNGTLLLLNDEICFSSDGITTNWLLEDSTLEPNSKNVWVINVESTKDDITDKLGILFDDQHSYNAFKKQWQIIFPPPTKQTILAAMKPKKDKKIGIERFYLLIHGYVHQLSKNMNILTPKEVLDLIILFCPKINGLLYSWIINDTVKLYKIFNEYKMDDSMQCDIFITDKPVQLKWSLIFFPNGKKDKDEKEGNLRFGPKLESNLNELKYCSILINFRVSCAQITSSQTTNIGILTPERTEDIWSLQELQLNTLQKLYEKGKIDNITLNITINILRIYNKENNIIYNFDPGFNEKEVYFDWKIDKLFLENFCEDMTSKYESGIYYDMFLIEIQHDENENDEWCLRGLLKICGIIPNVVTMKLDLQMILLETQAYSQSKNVKFSLDVNNPNKFAWRWWSDLLTPITELKKFNHVTLRTFVTIK